MSDDKTSASQNRLTIHHITMPGPSSSALHLLTLGGGLFVCFFGGMALSIGCLRVGLGSPSATLDFLISLMCGFAAAAAFTWAFHSYHTRKRTRIAGVATGAAQVTPDSDRTNIDWVIAEVKHILYSDLFNSRALRTAAKAVPPGHALWINAKRPEDSIDPISTDISFEPIDLKSDVEQLAWLCTAILEIRECQLPAQPQRNQSPHVMKTLFKKYLGMTLRWTFMALQLSYLSSLVYYAMTNGLSLASVSLFLLISMWGIVWVKPLFFDRQWFLIPGGLLLREATLFPRRDTFRIVTPVTHGIVIDDRFGVAAINDRNRTLKLTCPNRASWAILAAWLSTARTPTESEIRSFLGLPAQADSNA